MKNILRLIAFAIVMLMYGGLAWGQGVYVVGSSRATDTNKVPAWISIFAKNVRLTQYASADSNKVLGINAAGDLVLRTKAAVGGYLQVADSDIYTTVASFERDKNNNTQWYQASYNTYTFNLVTPQFFNDTNIDGVKLVQLGEYIYLIEGWNGIYNPKVKMYVFKWHVSCLDCPPVRLEDAPFLGRHGTPVFVQNGKITVMGSDGQLLPTRQWDAWEATADDTGKLTWVQTNPHCDGCGELFMDGALNPADGGFYYGGGQDTVNYTYGLSDSLFVTFDNGRTSTFIGNFDAMKGNIIGSLQFYEDNILHIICGGGLYHSTQGLRTYSKSHKTINVITGDTAVLPDYPGVPVQYVTTAVADGKILVYGGSNSSGVNTAGLYTYDINKVYTTITNSTLPATHATGLLSYIDTNGIEHITKIAGNLTDDVWRIDINKPGFAKEFQDVTFGLLTADYVTSFYADHDFLRSDTIKNLHGNSISIISPTINLWGTTWHVSTTGILQVDNVTNGATIKSYGTDGSTPKSLAVNNKLQIGLTTPIATASSHTLYIENIGANVMRINSNASRYMELLKSGTANNPNWEYRYVYASTLFSSDGSISGSGDRYWGYGIRVDSTSKLVVGSRTQTADGAMWLKTTFSRGLGLYTSKATTVDITVDNDTNLSIMCDIDNMVYMPDSLIIGAATGNSANGSRLNVLGGAYFDGKVSLKTGSNKSFGTATLSGGTITVNTTAVTANSKIYVTPQGCTNCGTPYISALSAGTSFTISSTNVLDASTVAWWIVDAQ